MPNEKRPRKPRKRTDAVQWLDQFQERLKHEDNRHPLSPEKTAEAEQWLWFQLLRRIDEFIQANDMTVQEVIDHAGYLLSVIYASALVDSPRGGMPIEVYTKKLILQVQGLRKQMLRKGDGGVFGQD
jgi:hypothetical protein